MLLLDLTLPTPAENLALDEALLDHAEAVPGFAALRLYESAATFVVVGYGNAVAREVDEAACAAAGVPVLRRTSGGGTVVLGPGCLGYALILPLDARPELAGLGAANRRIMETLRAALAPLLPGPVTIEGHTDLALAGCKFSGNAQRRKRRALLFHGTLLCGLDLALVTRLLRHPSLEPDYRAGRPHAGFLTNLPLAPAALAAALAAAWPAVPGPPPPGLADVTADLVRERYGTAAWNRRR